MINSKVEKREHLILIGEYGLFAKEDIRANERVWWIDSTTDVSNYTAMNWNQIQALDETEKERWLRYSYQIGNNLFMGPVQNTELEEGWFINHSCVPNCWVETDSSFVAMYDIQKNVELTIGYETIWSYDDCIEHCRCGTPYCRGAVLKDDFRNLPPAYRDHMMSYMKKLLLAD